MQTPAETVSPVARPVVSSAAVQCVILEGISWETYERLLAEHNEVSGTHFTYDRGRLEIMVLSAQHEAVKHALTVLVGVLAEELNIDVYGLGSTTFRRADLERGFEPDACFYIQRESLVRGKNEVNLTVDPPPDLIIEIDITSPSLDKLPLFATLGVEEVWRYDGVRVTILKLEAGEYVETAASAALLGVTGEALAQFIDASKQLAYTSWLRSVREWVRKNLVDKG
jgi:Uma2 family endonuclease